MHNLRTAITSMAICAALVTAAQTTRSFTADKTNEYALVYSLPRTVLDITIETVHTATLPGEFSNYAKRYLGITDAITTPSNSVRVKSVTIIPRGIPGGADSRWQVQFKNGSAASMLLTETGIPLAVNTDSIASTNAVTLPVAVDAAPTPLESDAARQAVTQDMTRSSSISKKAELAAQRIFELRETRSDLLSGNADNPPADGKAMQLVLDNLAAQEAALTAMFAGTTQTYTRVTTLTYTPGTTESREILARVSPTEGIVPADDLSGAPIYISLTNIAKAEMPVTEKGEPKRFPKGGLAYTIPGTASVTLTYDGATITHKDLTLAQLGVVFGINPALFSDKKAPAYATFDPTTGAITALGAIE